MKATWRGFVLALAGAAGVGVACGGSTTANTPGGVCDRFFDAVYGAPCNGVPLPASERARIQARFDKACAALIALPGSSANASTLDACASAVSASGCSALNGAACAFGSGSLPGGSSCITDSQCQNGDCTAGSGAPDGGTQACGQCGTGPNCADATCGPDTTCSISSGLDGGTVGTCLPITRGDAGAPCNGIETLCKAGLTCNRAVGRCSTLGGAGAPCGDTSDCSGSLVCPVTPNAGTSTCQSPGKAGAPCGADSACAAGLGCDYTKNVCATITWVDAGQACSPTARCLVGYCPISPVGTNQSGTCPTVIPDGQPCNSSDQTQTCDTYATCAGGVCLLFGQSSCP